TPQGQDAYFAAAARAVFEALARGIPHPAAALDALTRAAGERRLLVWSADPAEEASLAGTVLGGGLPERDGAEPTVGVVLTDGSGAKLDYCLRGGAALGFDSCSPDGRVALRLRVTLTSAAPTSGLSASVTGLHLAGDPYTARTNVSIFSPAGGA